MRCGQARFLTRATDNPEARGFFSHGLTLLYAFNHPEAMRAFRSAAARGDCMPASLCYHAVMGRQLTIRGVSEEVENRLKSVSRARGQSVNAIVLEILTAAVGVDERRRRLARYMTWNPEDLAEFNEAVAAQRSTDDPLWR
jgi:plasmid stability protein